MKPIIGLTTEVTEEKLTRLKNSYVCAIADTGGIPFPLPYTENAETIDDFVALCDGFVFTGGADIDPAYFGEEKKSTCGAVFEYRDRFELALFSRAIESKKPILSICRGMQVINVALGGTLYQDIPSEYETEILHKQTAPSGVPWHDVLISQGSVLQSLSRGKVRMAANSFHHQAIKDVASVLSVTATAVDGIVEAFTHGAHPYLRGYQWHPERLYTVDADNRRIFEEFIEACQKQKK